jgi:hypothetical protein
VADEQIKIEIVLDDGSVKQGFAKIIKDGEGAAGGLESAFLGVGKAIAGIAAAYLSVRALGSLFESATKAAVEQENAVTRLNNSLKLAGSFSEEASNTFRDFADKMQLATNVEDEQVLALASLARNYTKTNEAAIDMTKTAIDLAAATGVDAETALRQLGGTLSGVTGQLGKLTPELKNMTEAQLKAGAAVDILGQRFQGAAAGQINTFSGRIDALKIQFGELLEVIGGKIVQSPAIISALGAITQAITMFTSSAKSALGSGDIFKPVLLQLADIGMAFTAYVIQPIELITQITLSLVRVFITGFQSVVFVISAVTDSLNALSNGLAATGKAVIDFATGASSISDAAKSVKEGFSSTSFASTEKNFQALTEAANKSYKAVNDFGKSLDVSNAIGATLQKVTDAVNASGVPQAFKNITGTIKNGLDIDFKEIMAKFTALQEQLRTESLTKAEQLTAEFNSRNALALQAYEQGLVDFKTYLQTKEQIETAYELKRAELAGSAQKAYEAMDQAFRAGVLNSLSAGIAASSKALANGKNAFQAFSSAVLPIIGNMAIQIGTTLLGIGLGIEALRASLVTLSGGQAIAAGIALIAIGALLQNLSSGSAAANTGSASGSAVFGPPTPVDQVDAVDEGKKSQITVNVQGDVLDSRESGLRIVELINDAFDTQGARVTAGA